MKRSLWIIIALLLALTLCVAGCVNQEPEPSPTPSAAMPTDNGTTGTNGTGDLNGMGTENNGSGNGTGAGNSTGDMNSNNGSIGDMLIPDFAEGTEIDQSDVPEIKAALQERHEGATINRITHATYNGRQAYLVEYADQNGVIGTVYMNADGTFIEAPQQGESSGSGGAAGSNGAAGESSGSTGTNGSGGANSGTGGSTGTP